MDNPNKEENHPIKNQENSSEEKQFESEINNNIIKIKEENIIINKNDLNQINTNIENNNEQNMALNQMDIEYHSEIKKEEQNSMQENENDETKKERTSLIRYPLAKIKNIMKLDSDIKLCQKDAYTVIGKLTELFLQDLAQGAYTICKSCKRKTINLEDINSAIKMNPKMGFIDFNSIFYVEELNKIKKRPNSTKKNEKKVEENYSIQKENNSEEPKEKKKRGKSTKTKNKKIVPANNMTLESMFGPKK